MWSGSPVRTGQSLRRRSPAKWKHLKMIGTPVWCLPWELRCLSASHGPGCSGRSSRVGYLGCPGVGWLSPVPAGADPVRVECGPEGLLSILDTFPEVEYSEHNLVRYAVHPGETVGSDRLSVFSRTASGRVTSIRSGRSDAFTLPGHSRRWYFVVGADHDINIEISN
ncbi:hypothetical protein TIFTF001_020925 [Ficus carica]|uniref:Uncharacterized protein n=1 Tax=Ficus carica TaxID=3494 RepID=A0AA88AYF3_FICCA|nr:hypothetical protein TIFTF001_020925 [Ficus carica]